MSKTILVIEDDPVMRETICELFQKKGVRTLQAASAEEGMRLFREKRADIILLDLKLPDGDGCEVLKAIRDKDDLVPVIVVTAIPQVKTAVTAMKLGATDYITKPF